MLPKPKAFSQPPPVNYVAGLGRGAIGFTTRSDIGPARLPPEPSPNFGTPPPGYVAGRGRGMGMPGAVGMPNGEAEPGKRKRDDDDDDDDDVGDYSESNYDEFEGYGGGLWDPSAPYEKDDEEADAVWDSVDKKLDSRRKIRREARFKKEIEKFRATRPKIQQQFADLKKNLESISDAEWAAIPEIGDYSLRFKKRPERYTPAPDSLLERARMENEHINAIDSKINGLESVAGTASSLNTPISQDLTQIGEARKTVLNLKLHQASDSVAGQTVVDPKHYLTDLKSIKINTDAEIGDIKRARLLLRSVTTTNPRHAPGWIAAARLEEVAGKIIAARKLIMQGCQICPENEDVWLEAARLHNPENAQVIFARAVHHLPQSVKIWLAAASKETDIKAKKRILRRALEFNPTSLRLWKAAVELEEPEEARIMLSRAVECVPHRVEMWLALAHLETYDNAKKVLNRARETIPTDPSIWIAAAKLEEAHAASQQEGKMDLSADATSSTASEEAVRKIIKRAVKSLAIHHVLIDREQWIKEAENCEKCGAILTCQAIVRETIGIGVDDEDRKATWKADAIACLDRGSVQTARSIYAHASSVFPNKESIWKRAAQLEKTHGTRESLDQLLQRAVMHCPQAELLWLMAAKEKWLAASIEDARSILNKAFQFNPNSEAIWLAAVKLESDNNETQRARLLLEKAREHSGTERVWMKSALLERNLGNHIRERQLLEEAIKRFPKFPKLWMMMGQLEEREIQAANDGKLENLTEKNKARDVYQKGLIHCPHSIELWLSAARWEEKSLSTSKARSLLEKARLRNPRKPELWLAAIRVELRAGNKKIAQNLLAKALQEIPNSGILWAQAIAMEPRPKQKAISVQALQRCDDDPHVIVAVAKIFWDDRKVEKARNWFERAVTLNPNLGDTWAHYYKFEIQHGDEPQKAAQITKRCIEADPHNGELWCSISKAPEYSQFSVEQILHKVALLLNDNTSLLGPAI